MATEAGDKLSRQLVTYPVLVPFQHLTRRSRKCGTKLRVVFVTRATRSVAPQSSPDIDTLDGFSATRTSTDQLWPLRSCLFLSRHTWLFQEGRDKKSGEFERGVDQSHAEPRIVCRAL